MIDDFSQDKSVDLIKELMESDPRIVLYQNQNNKGMLYTKTKGFLNAKGKYVMSLDEDDLYAQRDAFTTLYEEAEKNNLDILGFSLIISENPLIKGTYMHYYDTPVLFQPDVSKRMYDVKPDGKIERYGDLTSIYLFKTDFIKKAIRQIDNKYLNVKMNHYDDYLLFFYLTRKAYNLKQIKRIFYIVLKWPQNMNKQLIFREKEKSKNIMDEKCLGIINLLEFYLMNTNNSIEDKKIASYEFSDKFINFNCINNNFTKKIGINLCKLFLNNKYIEANLKNQILSFMNISNQTILYI